MKTTQSPQPAAPELLAALRQIANASSYIPSDTDSIAYAYNHVREKARAAIALATGAGPHATGGAS